LDREVVIETRISRAHNHKLLKPMNCVISANRQIVHYRDRPVIPMCCLIIIQESLNT